MKQSQRKPPKKQNRYREIAFRLTLFTAIAVVSGAAGVATALVMSATPLRDRASQPHQNRITSLFPGSLARPINILVLGIDNSGHPHIGNFTPAEALSGNSDTMLLVRLDPDQRQVSILSIPRDTQVQIPGVGLDKINDANVQGGIKLAANTVSQLLSGVQIDRYIRIDTEEFVQLIDAIDGLEVNVPKKMNYEDHSQNLTIHFLPGVQTLNGQHLEEYVRYRHDEMGDIGRVERQQAVLKALLFKLMQPQMLIKLPKILQVVQQNTDTDLSLEEMLATYHTLTTVPRSQINVVTLPGRFSRYNEFPLSYWISDPEAMLPIVARLKGESIIER
ncbi:MAG TPA: LCP family protein [Leptolyngbya sp.]|nr:LCP family protein [Leptolyngbya sp.]